MSLTRTDYQPGQKVLVEAEVVSYDHGVPFGAVTVRFPEGTDPSFLLDGVDVVLPQVIVHPGVVVPVCSPDYSVIYDGYYPQEDTGE